MTTALIPAAGRVSESVVALSNVSSPAMIPVAGRPLIQWTMGYLTSLGITSYRIAVPERGLFIEEFVSCVFGPDIDVEFLVPGADRGVGGTVAELAERCDPGPALVVLGDTHFHFHDPEVLNSPEPVVLVDEVEESYRWCVADIGDDGLVVGLHDKEPDLTGNLQALIGVYWFPDDAQLRQATGDATRSIEGPIQMSDILDRVAKEAPIRAVKAGTWLDCGNPDRQAASQRTLLEQRAFNELTLDATFGTITKRSTHVEKFIDEINYLRLLPPDLSVFFPRVIDFSTDWEHPHLTLEFYGYPTLAELFVFENVDPGIWRRVFEHLRAILTDGFMRRRRPVPADTVREMFLTKARDRLASLDGPEPLVALRDADTLTINGVTHRNLTGRWSELAERVDGLTETSIGAVVHGDLCFSNILYDLRSGVCKLVDPRGSFGRTGIYGDVRYDVAKLWHSVYGLYDFITADLFQLEVAGTDVSLDIRTRPHHERVRREFEDVFFPSFDRNEIALVTALLFASLPALHYDHPRRQLAMYARSHQLLAEALGED